MPLHESAVSTLDGISTVGVETGSRFAARGATLTFRAVFDEGRVEVLHSVGLSPEDAARFAAVLLAAAGDCG